MPPPILGGPSFCNLGLSIHRSVPLFVCLSVRTNLIDLMTPECMKGIHSNLGKVQTMIWQELIRIWARVKVAIWPNIIKNSVLGLKLQPNVSGSNFIHGKDLFWHVKHFWKFEPKGHQMTKYGQKFSFGAITPFLMLQVGPVVNQINLLD